MVVLGIDVGIRACGYVVCTINKLKIELIKENQIKPDSKKTLPQKLNHIFEELKKQVTEFSPEAMIVEKLYSHYRHPVTLGVLAQVRGVVALLAHKKNIEFFEYSSTRARKSFLGRGNVNSEQVKKMAENMIGKKMESIHAADAYSLVVAFSHEQKFRQLKNQYSKAS